MLTATARIRRREDFAATIKGGRRAGHVSLVVHVSTARTTESTGNPAGASARAGFVVSKAVGGAVVRNQVKRRLRHLVRDRLEAVPSGTDLVVRALPRAAGRSFTELGDDLDQALAAALRPRRSTQEHRGAL